MSGQACPKGWRLKRESNMRMTGCLLMTLLMGCGSEPVEPPQPSSATDRVAWFDGGTAVAPDYRAPAAAPTVPNCPSREEIAAADVSVLFIGNSHSAAWNLPAVVASIARRGDPERKVLCHLAPFGAFLADHVRNPATRQVMDAGPWKFVVLQAQKYSTSGKYSYPFDAAVELSEIATKNGARVIMFPEWGQRGDANEGRRVHRLHEKIAGITGAEVAPVGLAWDRALRERPELGLHDLDGNHATALGTYLAAAVISATITKEDPRQPDFDSSRSEDFLDQQAWATVTEYRAAAHE